MVARYSEQMGVSPTSVSFKPMISRWGVCNVRARSICYSAYLLLLPTWCVEHVVVHELCHLLEPSHNARFHVLMDQYYPHWCEARKETSGQVYNKCTNVPGGIKCIFFRKNLLFSNIISIFAMLLMAIYGYYTYKQRGFCCFSRMRRNTQVIWNHNRSQG